MAMLPSCNTDALHGLIERCLRDDREAWDELWRLMEPPLRKKVHRLLGYYEIRDATALDDIMQNVWKQLTDPALRLLAKYQAGRAARGLAVDGASVLRFLGRIARYKIRDAKGAERARHRREHVVAHQHLEAQPADLTDRQLLAGVQALADKLPPPMQQALRHEAFGEGGSPEKTPPFRRPTGVRAGAS
jgi:DNA-directed RNA polymerase specialized sigma24 family protein